MAWEDEQGGQLAADANLAWAAQRVEINMAQEEVQKRQIGRACVLCTAAGDG